MTLDVAYDRAIREAFCQSCNAMPGEDCHTVGRVKWPPHAERLAFVILLDAEIAALSSATPPPPRGVAEGWRRLPPPVPASGACPRPPGAASDDRGAKR